MTSEGNQKLKLYYLSQIMINQTDDNHSLKLSDIQALLEEYDISADRKTLYTDLQLLEKTGIEIIKEGPQNNRSYHVGKKQFEIAELKLLVDAVQSSKFITEKKSKELIDNLTKFCSHYEAQQLNCQVVVSGRIKSMNESIYYTVDDINKAISENKRIKFLYYRWDKNKKLLPKKEGRYDVSPWALAWDHENYYLIAYDTEEKRIKHFRVDKIGKIQTSDQPRQGKDVFEKCDLASYSKMNFNMFGGKTSRVKIAFEQELVGVFIDQFGKDIIIGENGQRLFTEVKVSVSNQFFGWIFALGDKVEILEPSEVREEYINAIGLASKKYENEKESYDEKN